MKVVLLGLMGAGKTAVGEELARRLDCPFSDSDRTILAATGKTAKEIQDVADVAPLHALEAQHLLDALSSPGPAVIGAAASVVENERCRSALRATSVFCIWLRATPETLAMRFASGPHRPNFGDPSVFLRQQSAARSPLFEALSAVTIDVDDLDVNDVVAAAEAAIRLTSS
jgi:shikimate kinase